MKTNYVLIDYENVQPAAMAVLAQEHFKVIVFVGTSQAKIAFEVASALQHLGSRAEYVKISGNGPNALDFHIAFYIGQLAAQDPNAYFHIISKDTGFDPLIQHLKSKKVLASRSQDITDLPSMKATQPTPATDKLTVIITHLRQMKAAKPGSVKTLSSTINAIFQKKLSEKEISSLVQQLQKQGVIAVNDTKVSYKLPG